VEVIHQQYKRVDVLKPSGRIDSATAPKLAECLWMITNDHRYRIVIDMSETDYISSAGLRVLIDAQKTCRRHNRGNLVLARPNEPIRKTLDLAGFLVLFDVYDDVTAAVGSV
jgi:anti-sigma B factor antagonist